MGFCTPFFFLYISSMEKVTIQEKLIELGYEDIYAPKELDKAFIGLTENCLAVYDEDLIGTQVDDVVNDKIVIIKRNCEIPTEALLIGNAGEQADEYKKAIIGVSNNGRVVYDYDRLIEVFGSYNKWSSQEAIEWYEYNTLRSLPYYPNHPYVVTNIDYMM